MIAIYATTSVPDARVPRARDLIARAMLTAWTIATLGLRELTSGMEGERPVQTCGLAKRLKTTGLLNPQHWDRLGERLDQLEGSRAEGGYVAPLFVEEILIAGGICSSSGELPLRA